MFEDPKVVAAIVAATVSLLVSAISGFYTIAQNRKRFEILRNEILAKSGAESFVKGREKYLDSYRDFERALVAIDKNNPNDGTKAIQFSIDYYSDTAKDFYLRNKSFLQTAELTGLLDSISATVESGALSDPDNLLVKREFGKNIIAFCSKLNERALEVN